MPGLGQASDLAVAPVCHKHGHFSAHSKLSERLAWVLLSWLLFQSSNHHSLPLLGVAAPSTAHHLRGCHG